MAIITRSELTLTDVKETVVSNTAPLNPSLGDVWYKQNGKYVEQHRWNGVQWEFISSTKETEDIKNQLIIADEKINAAQEKADESLEKAQEGFDKAEALSEKVDANTGAISTVKQTTAGLQTAVKNKADSSVVTQLADVVASKVSNVDFETNQTQTAELISSTVKQSVNLNGNLLLDSAFQGDFWGKSSGGGTISVDKDITHLGTNSIKLSGGTTAGIPTYIHPYFSEKSFELIGKKVTLSVYVYVSSAVKPTSDIFFEFCGYENTTRGANAAILRRSIKITEIEYDKWARYEVSGIVTKTTTNGANNFYRVLLRVNNNTPAKSVVYYAKPQLEIADYATSWKTSESDNASQSQISQLADNINLKVDTGDVINQINIDPKGIIISGKKISLDGDVSVLPGFKLKAETINGGTFNGNSFIKAIDLKDEAGHNVTGESSIDDEGIIITQKTKDPVSGTELSETRSILNNGITIGTPLDYSNGEKNIDYKKEYSQLSKYALITPDVVRTTDKATPYWNGTGSSNLSTSEALLAGGIATSATNFYMGADGEVRVTDANGYNSGKTIGYKPIKASSFIISGDEAFTTDSGYAILRSATNSDAVFLQGSEVRVTAHKSVGTYRPIRASAFTVSSSRDVKKNIEDYSGDALELVNGTRVTEYNLKDENEDIDYKRIGLIVQESPIEIINFIGGDSIDLYEMASILWKSVQELDAKNKALEKEKNNLNERLSKIESLLNLD